MRIYYIRHAQSSNNLLYATTGGDAGRVCDPEITALGREQAVAVAELLRSGHPGPQTGVSGPGFGITHLYCSLMVRAVDTASVIGAAVGLAPQGLLELHETGGIFLENRDTEENEGLSGSTRQELLKRFPQLGYPEEARPDGWWNRPFEEVEERLPRARRLLAEVLKRHANTNDQVALVSHGGFYNYFITALMGLPQRSKMWFTLYNCSVSRIDFNEQGPALEYSNRVDFLTPQQLT